VMVRFVAERGERAQLTHVENIHRSYELKPIARLVPTPSRKRIAPPSPEKPLPVMSTVPR